jgi:hypothetical protein
LLNPWVNLLVWADQKVVNFEQILFANGRILFDRNPSGCPFPSLRNMSSERKSMASEPDLAIGNWTYGFDLNIHGD